MNTILTVKIIGMRQTALIISRNVPIQKDQKDGKKYRMNIDCCTSCKYGLSASNILFIFPLIWMLQELLLAPSTPSETYNEGSNIIWNLISSVPYLET
jgi:hypothetical protein